MLRFDLLTVGGLFVFTFASGVLNAQQLPRTSTVNPVRQGYLPAWESSSLEAELASVTHDALMCPDDCGIKQNCCPEPVAGWYAGAELVIVKPYWEDEIDTITTILPGDDVEFVTTEQLDPDYNCSLSPRVYLGHRNCDGFGWQVRYWLYDESANTLTTTNDFDEPLTLDASLNVQAFDFEATKLITDGLFSMGFTGGVRYAKTRVEASLETVILNDITSFMGRATFEGIGPTISGMARQQLGSSPFAIVGNMRGSLLFGQSNVTNNVVGGFFPQTLINEGKDDVVTVVEAQIGAEYAKCTRYGRFAFRAMMEGQWWGVATPGASFSNDLQPGGNMQADLFNTGRDLGFFGVTAAFIYTH